MTPMTLDGLLALEHDGWAALCAGRGAAFYGDVMTADGLMVLANGLVLDRDQVVASPAAEGRMPGPVDGYGDSSSRGRGWSALTRRDLSASPRSRSG